ncbi:hypothetical protein E2C01_070256 [Portunus trituberculatus]|uniref:Uncharacterized protein n=1 Tax=Portunus trituberculatus TaxID=210409 RepID=A0A5B7I1S7_PORTR|nr:hypothetical protein [Portunus trituberculatus]
MGSLRACAAWWSSPVNHRNLRGPCESIRHCLCRPKGISQRIPYEKGRLRWRWQRSHDLPPAG